MRTIGCQVLMASPFIHILGTGLPIFPNTVTLVLHGPQSAPVSAHLFMVSFVTDGLPIITGTSEAAKQTKAVGVDIRGEFFASKSSFYLPC